LRPGRTYLLLVWPLDLNSLGAWLNLDIDDIIDLPCLNPNMDLEQALSVENWRALSGLIEVPIRGCE